MTAATGHAHAHPDAAVPAHAGPATFVAALWSALGHARDRARAIESLNRLDDRALKDIGVHRTEITSIVHHRRQDPSRRPR